MIIRDKVLSLRSKIESFLIEKMKKDPSFVEKIKSHPKETFLSILDEIDGLKPSDISYLKKVVFKFYLEKENEFMMVIPQVFDQSQKLSGGELKKLSGGGSCACCW